MPHADFVHLRVHSAYSLSQGAIRVAEIAELARAAAMPAVAITDSGNLFGALEFSQYCSKQGVQPVIGCQVGLGGAEKRGPAGAEPIVLLARTEEGLANLQRLSTLGFLRSDPADPCLTMETIAEHARGLFLLTGG
ncbi:MAG: PHP domain-containing protein, partial [Gluconacetobacter diazotrophicus]|nr:PHP domain-containing protein [Gluconacetobacter diazotrophicus]